MTRTIVIICFLVAFAAGLMVGVDTHPAAAPPTTQPARHGGWGLTTELGLNPTQQEQMKKIWSETASHGGRERMERRRKLYGERDQAIAALIGPENKSRYEQIMKQYEGQMGVLDSEWHNAFQTAVERTKQILTPEQRVKYEEMLQRHQREHGSKDRRHGERDSSRRGDRGATSRPAGQS